MFNRNIAIVVGVGLFAFILFAALGPARMVPRTGLGWQVDHFTGYMVFTGIFCGVWRRVFPVGAGVAAFAILLEVCQGFTPDRMPDLMGAFFSLSGVLTATLLADLIAHPRKLVHGLSFIRAPY